jgi:hypothetical protein
MLAILIICFGYYNTVNISGLEILYNIDYYIFNKNESAISIIDIIFELFFNMVINLIVNIVKTYFKKELKEICYKMAFNWSRLQKSISYIEKNINIIEKVKSIIKYTIKYGITISPNIIFLIICILIICISAFRFIFEILIIKLAIIYFTIKKINIYNFFTIFIYENKFIGRFKKPP